MCYKKVNNRSRFYLNFSLLEGPYETLDLNKELARRETEELYETFVVPNTEDKYGGPNCICHCHRIEDNEYKSRLKHCNSCGLKVENLLEKCAI